MPPPKHRKKPFSAKQKKEQLRTRKERKRQTGDNAIFSSRDERAKNFTLDVDRLNHQPTTVTPTGYEPNKYSLHFAKETNAQIEERKKEARQPIVPLDEAELEVDVDTIYQADSILDIPKRPAWQSNMSKEVLEQREHAYFKRYLEELVETHSGVQLSYFECNLETWRQLWRVLEMSDIILLITDIRHPSLHLSPAFYHHVTHDLAKPLILVLNKVDLSPPGLVAAWRAHLIDRFPKLVIICFASFSAIPSSDDPTTVLHKRRRKSPSTAASSLQLLRACEDIVQGRVDLHSWEEKILETGLDSGSSADSAAECGLEEVTTTFETHQQYKDGVLTIGCCGYPNVGKSSLINGLVRKKVVSVSRTPGHTKHFQTIFLTPTVKLCDSPGLVFPSLIQKPMQILAGIYPIAQVREPYTPVGFLAQRIDLPSILKLRHPDAVQGETEAAPPAWTAYDICEAWAEKRGYLTAKAARPDVYRAANSILRLAVDGRLRMCVRPPGFLLTKQEWSDSEAAMEIARLQADHRATLDTISSSDLSDDEEEEDEEEPAGRDDTVGDQTKTAPQTSNPFSLLMDDDD